MLLHMVGSSLWFCVGEAPKGPVLPHLQLAWTPQPPDIGGRSGWEGYASPWRVWAGSLSSAWAADESRGGTNGVHQALVSSFSKPGPQPPTTCHSAPRPPGGHVLSFRSQLECHHLRESLSDHSGQEPPRLVTHDSLSRAQTTVSKTLKRDSVDDLAVMVAFWWLSLKVSLSFRVTS